MRFQYTYDIESLWGKYYITQKLKVYPYEFQRELPNIKADGYTIYYDNLCSCSLNFFNKLLTSYICTDFFPEEDPYVIFQFVRLPDHIIRNIQSMS